MTTDVRIDAKGGVRLHPLINSAERNGRITTDEARSMRRDADQVHTLREHADSMEQTILGKVMRAESA